MVRRVAAACAVGGSAWTSAALGALAKSPVMKLPDGERATFDIYSSNKLARDTVMFFVLLYFS